MGFKIFFRCALICYHLDYLQDEQTKIEEKKGMGKEEWKEEIEKERNRIGVD